MITFMDTSVTQAARWRVVEVPPLTSSPGASLGRLLVFEQRGLGVSAASGFGSDVDLSVEYFLVEERAHEFFVGAVAQSLGFVVDGGGVLAGVARAFFCEVPGEDLLRGPAVDGVGGDFDFEHPVGEIFADTALARPALRGARR